VSVAGRQCDSSGFFREGYVQKFTHPSVFVPSVRSVSSRCGRPSGVPPRIEGARLSDNEWVKRIERMERTGTE